MPIYVYQCEACRATEEHMQRIADPPMTECQACGGALRRKISAAAFHLKGGGWYKDGYASAKPDGGGGGDGGGGDGGGGGTSSDGGGKPSEGTSKPAGGKSDAPAPAKTSATD